MPVIDVFSANSLEAQAQGCGTTREGGYYTELVSKLTGDVITYTFTEKKMAKDNEYVVTLMPNTPEYIDEDSFKADFNVCAEGGTYPFSMNADWLVFVKNCSADTDGSNTLPISKTINYNAK